MQRTDTQTDIKKRQDRVGKYLEEHLKDFVFDEFSIGFMEKAGVKELMEGVPIPIKKANLQDFEEGYELKTLEIAENMAWIMGIDLNFKYTEHYMGFMSKLYGHKSLESLAKDANDMAQKKNFDGACILFRACLCLNPNYLPAMYGYAQVCRQMYLQGGDEDYVGNFKAESIELFELLTEAHPDFAPAYYFLGYAYLNLGLYMKANIIWKQFIDKTENPTEKSEIMERLKQLELPVKIESGCNDVMAGRYEEGLFKLESDGVDRFEDWWPLFFYLGIAYAGINDEKAAIFNFKKVLRLNSSHIETMEELVLLYESVGDEDNRKKYMNKIELIKSQKSQKE